MENDPHEPQPALPDMELVEYIDNMTELERMAHKRLWLSQISDREMLCRMVDDANANEGVDVSIFY